MMQEINIAIIGCGRISGHHAEAIRQTSGLSLVAACDLDPWKVSAYAHKYQVPRYTNYHRMLQELPKIDLVVVATPSGMHFEHSMEIMEKYKKNIIVEKPTFMRPDQVVQAYDTAKKNQLHIFPIFQNRYNKAVQRVKNAIEHQELGDPQIFSVRVRWCRTQHYYDSAQWRGTFSLDGGAFSNQGIHHIDLLRYLGGEIDEVTSVFRTFGAQIEVEDSGVAIVKFKNGAIGTLEITTAARPDNFEASLSVVCTKGLAQIGGNAVNKLELFSPNPNECSQYSEDFTGSVYGNGHKFLYQSIADFFHKKSPNLINEQDCLNTVKLLHAFYNSPELGRAYRLDENKESERLGEYNEKLFRLYRTQH